MHSRCDLPTQQKRTCKIMQDCARILHARLAWHVHAICPFSCTILARFLHNLAHTLQEMLQDFARVAFLAHFLQYLARIGARLCKNCARTGHIACTCQASLACKNLARFLHDLASSLLLGSYRLAALPNMRIKCPVQIKYTSQPQDSTCCLCCHMYIHLP